MKVAVVSPYALDTPGGVQQQVIGLVERLQNHGDQAYVVAPGAGEGPDRINVGRSITVRTNRSRAPLGLTPGVARRVGKALAPADVVHIHEPFAPLVGWTALAARKPKVVTFHADPPPTVKALYRGTRALLRRILRGCITTAVSRTARQGIDMPGVRPMVIPNAIDVGAFGIQTARNHRRVAFVGRPEPRKGRDLLLDSWPEVRSQVPDAELVIVGGGDEPPVEGVRYLGRVDEQAKRDALAGSAVFCAPNRGGESFGITVAEGMAAGCAVVASDLQAFSDVLAGSGLLFPNGDRPALTAALVRALTDSDLRHRLSTASQTRVLTFDWGKVTNLYRNLYCKALDTVGRNGRS